MNKIKTLLCPVLFLMLVFINGCNLDGFKNPPFWNEIQKFKKADKKNPPVTGCTLFVGSSSFRKWTELEQVFAPYRAINRGFGGATLIDVLRYFDDVILPYQPRQIVLYCGDNDIATDTVDANMVFARFEQVFQKIRQAKPDVSFAYLSIKPSPARTKYMPIQIESNRLISAYLKNQTNTQFINIWPLLLDKNGLPRQDLVVEDSLHLNQQGYQIWAKAIKPYLIIKN